jgi:ABC transporter substrate binding protein
MQMTDRLREHAADMVRRKPDIIVAFSTTAALPAKQATDTIPIVAVAMADPVADELVASLARPGGNVDDISRPGAGLQASTTAARGRSWPLPCGGPLASQCIQQTHDDRRTE